MGQSIRFPRSHCPRCQHSLRLIDNIPIFSFLFLRGHCHFCRAPITWQYPLVEMSMTLLFILNARLFASTLQCVVMDLFTFYLLIVSVIDFDHGIIPDELSLSLAVLGLIEAWFNPFLGGGIRGLGQSLAGGFAGGAGMLVLAWLGEKIFKREALGGGDIKLMVGIGTVLGWVGPMGSLLIGSLLGGIAGLILILIRKKKREETLPFGPFLSLGAFLTCVLPPEWLRMIFP